MTTPQGKTTSIKTGLWALGPSSSSDAAILMLNVDQPRSAGIIKKTFARPSRRRG